MKRLHNLFFCALAVVAMASCEETVLPGFLDIANTEVSIPNVGGKVPLSFNASSAWTLESSVDWVSFDKSSGEEGDYTIVATVAVNSGFEARTAVITLKTDEKETSWKLTQSESGVSAVALTYNVAFGGETFTLGLNTNREASFTVAESASSWISIAQTKAAPVASTLTVTVAANTGSEDRSGEIYVMAGESSYTITIAQNHEIVTDDPVFKSTVNYEVSAAGEVIDFDLNTNMPVAYVIGSESAEWISYVAATKALPESSTMSFQVAANTTLDAREGVVSVLVGEECTFSLVVKQGVAAEVVELAKAEYLATSQWFYNDEEWEYTSHFAEYYLEFNTELGVVGIAVNAEPVEAPLAAFPTGEFKIDDGTHAAGTFAPVVATEDYGTFIKVYSAVIPVVDGTVTIEQNDGVYTVLAQLVDEDEATHEYLYKGAIEVADNSFHVYFDGAIDYYSDYNTFKYGGGIHTREYDVRAFVTAAPDENTKAFSYFSLSFFAAEDADATMLPAGVYTYGEDYSANTFVLSTNTSDFLDYLYPYNEDYETVATGTITVSYNADGTMNLDIDYTGVLCHEVDFDWDTYIGTYDWIENYSYKACFSNLDPSVKDTGMKANPDTDSVVFSSQVTPGYQVQYAGDYYGDGGHCIMVGFQNVNADYTVYVTLHSKDTSFEFSTYAPVPNGTYAVVAAKPETNEDYIVHGSNTYRRVTNGYTGTPNVITGGSVTFNNGKVEFNLETTDGSGNQRSFTGTLNAASSGGRNATSSVKKAFDWKETGL